MTPLPRRQLGPLEVSALGLGAILLWSTLASLTALKGPVPPFQTTAIVFAIGSGLGVMCPPMRTIAFVQVREWNFRGPLFIGDTVKLRSKVLEKNLKGRGRRGEIVWYRGVVNQEGKVVQDGVLVTLVEGRVARRGETADAAEAVAAG